MTSSNHRHIRTFLVRHSVPNHDVHMCVRRISKSVGVKGIQSILFNGAVGKAFHTIGGLREG